MPTQVSQSQSITRFTPDRRVHAETMASVRSHVVWLPSHAYLHTAIEPKTGEPPSTSIKGNPGVDMPGKV
jgi:hypothetical protein